MVSLNFYGEGLRYWLCEIPLVEFDVIQHQKERTGKDWEQLFFDLTFLEGLGYNNWESIHLLEEGKGWIIAERNKIEIKNGRKKRVVKLDEFLGDNMLFQTFPKKVIPFEIVQKDGYQYVLLVQVDAGKINKYELESNKLDLDKFLFQFFDGRGVELDLMWLTKVEYDGKELFDQGDDCLTRQNMVRIL